MRTKYILFVLLIIPGMLAADVNVDSLKNVILSASDTAKLTAYEEISNYYLNSNFDSCLKYSEAGQIIAEKLQKAPQMNLFPTNIGTIYYQKGEFSKAVFYYLEALKISEKFNDTSRIAQTHNNLGIINMFSGENEKALRYFEQSLTIKKQLRNNELSIAKTKMNIGICHKNLGHYDQAYEYFMAALPDIEKEDKKSALAPIYNNIGIIFLFQKQYDKALEFYLKAELYADNYLPAYTRAVLLQNIGECYMFLNQSAKALSYLDKALTLALENGNLHIQKNIYNVLCDYYIEHGDYRKAYQYREKYEIVRDSVLNIEKKISIEELEAKYETVKKEQQNLLLTERIKNSELYAQKQKKISKLLLIIVLLAFASALLLLYFSRRIKRINIQLTKSKTDLENLNAELIASNHKVEAALSVKTEFIANMSHEIRTPLNIIIGFNSMLRRSITDKKLIAFIDAIEVSSTNLLKFLTDILDLSKMEAGKMELQPETINLLEVIEDIRNLFALRAEEKGISFSVEIDSNVPKGLTLDEIRLRQILVNLIGNAIKFTETGFVKLHIILGEAKPGFITSSNVANIVIEIEDSGPGIAIENQQEIFESFKQINIHNQKHNKGTGLGLAISKRLAEIMGGSISLISEVGKGSRFIVKFQNIPVIELVVPKKKFAGNIADFTDIIFKSGSILIADDEELNRNLVKACFENTPVKVIEAENGVEAVAATIKHQPNLVLMDLKMPDKDGYEAATEIKENKVTSLIPIFAFSASHLVEGPDELVKKLFAGFISKPVFVPELYDEVSRFIPHTRKSNPDDIIKSENNFDIPMDNDRDIVTPEILTVLENQFLNDWSVINNSNSINRIIEFAENLKTFAVQNNVNTISIYADEVMQSTKSFDIEKIIGQMKKFPEIIHLLKLLN